jgi:hypothetical protein
MLRKTIHATLIVILMMGAASAQGDQPGFFRGDRENSLRDRNLEKKSNRAIDRAYHSKQIDNDYKAATSKIPDQKANDPWAAIRPTPTAPAKKQQ